MQLIEKTKSLVDWVLVHDHLEWEHSRSGQYESISSVVNDVRVDLTKYSSGNTVVYINNEQIELTGKQQDMLAEFVGKIIDKNFNKQERLASAITKVLGE